MRLHRSLYSIFVYDIDDIYNGMRYTSIYTKVNPSPPHISALYKVKILNKHCKEEKHEQEKKKLTKTTPFDINYKRAS